MPEVAIKALAVKRSSRLPAWFLKLDLRESLLCWLSSAQQRYETAAIKAFGDRFSPRLIRLALRALANERHIMLMQNDRVTWAIHVSGRNIASAARARAKRRAAA